MKQCFETIASIQSFAAAFSRASAKNSTKPKIALNDTLHCFAVASGYKNWATMKSIVESSAETVHKVAQAGIPESKPNEYFELNLKHHFNTYGDVPHNLIVFSPKGETPDLNSYKLAVDEAIAGGHHVIILGHSEIDLEIFGVDVMNPLGLMLATEAIRNINKNGTDRTRIVAPISFSPRKEMGQFDMTPGVAIRSIVRELGLYPGNQSSTVIVIPDLDKLIALDKGININGKINLKDEMASFLLTCRKMSMSVVGAVPYTTNKRLLHVAQAHALCVYKN